jgi:MFS family permease
VTGPAAAVRRTFRSLSVRNFRLFYAGQVVSVTGTWMQQVAQMWLVLHLTQDGVALGLTAALQFTPVLVLGAWGGVLADRVDKRRVLLATQAAAGLLAAGLAVLTLTGRVNLWAVYAFAFALGLVNVVDNPTRQSFVSEMVGPRLVSNAVSLNSTAFTTARVLGPAAAGLLIAAVGTGWCFAYNAVSYVAVLLALLAMRRQDLVRAPARPRGGGQLREGIRYAWSRPRLRLPLLTMLAIGLLGFNFNVLLPLVATRVFHGGPGTYGLLFSLMGAGSVVGALFTANRGRPTMGLMLGAGMAFGALLLVAAGMPLLWLEAGLLALVGSAMTAYQATSNSLLQLNSRPELRGRVLALYLVVFGGTTPIGGPIAGWTAQTLGPRAAMAIAGAVAILAAVAATAWWRRIESASPSEDETVGEPGPAGAA